MKGEIAAGRLPENPGPIQSGVGAVGNAVLSCLESSGFKGLSMYTEVMQDSAFELLSKGVFDFISTSSIALTEENKKKFYENIDFYRDKVIVRPNEISNHPEVIRRLWRHRAEYTDRGRYLWKYQFDALIRNTHDERSGRKRRFYA